MSLVARLQKPRTHRQQATVAKKDFLFTGRNLVQDHAHTVADGGPGKSYCAWVCGLISVFIPDSWTSNIKSKPGQWGKNVGWRGPNRPTKTRNLLPMLSAGAPNNGVLCDCSTFLSITQTLHLLIHSPSLPPSLPHLSPILSIWI